jgi:hypothetical protein
MKLDSVESTETSTLPKLGLSSENVVVSSGWRLELAEGLLSALKNFLL